MATADDSEAQQPEGTTRYAVRLTPRADREAIEAAERLADIAGSEEVGRGWYGALLGTVGTLATNPTRFAVQERESRLLARPVRRLVYRDTLRPAMPPFTFTSPAGKPAKTVRASL